MNYNLKRLIQKKNALRVREQKEIIIEIPINNAVTEVVNDEQDTIVTPVANIHGKKEEMQRRYEYTQAAAQAKMEQDEQQRNIERDEPNININGQTFAKNSVNFVLSANNKTIKGEVANDWAGSKLLSAINKDNKLEFKVGNEYTLVTANVEKRSIMKKTVLHILPKEQGNIDALVAKHGAELKLTRVL